ncbi:MAG: CHASE domain-containing protein, partial [bacterium]
MNRIKRKDERGKTSLTTTRKSRWYWAQLRLLLGTFLIGTILSIFPYKKVNEWEQKRVLAQFEKVSSNQSITLQKGFDNYFEILYSIRAFYAASNHVDRQEFAEFVKSILERYPAIVALQWIPRVPAAKRAVFERATIREGLIDFEITKIDSDANLSIARNRHEFYPVYYVEPLVTNKHILGRDISADPYCRNNMQAAGETGDLMASIIEKKEPAAPDQSTIQLFLPIYRNSAATGTKAQRIENLTGYVSAVLSLNGMVSEILGDLDDKKIELMIRDESDLQMSRLLFHHRACLNATDTSSAKDLANSEASTIWQEQLGFANLAWELRT